MKVDKISRECNKLSVLGFDCEWKSTFKKGQPRHIVTIGHTFIRCNISTQILSNHPK